MDNTPPYIPLDPKAGEKGKLGYLHRSFSCARLPGYRRLFSALKTVVEDGVVPLTGWEVFPKLGQGGVLVDDKEDPEEWLKGLELLEARYDEYSARARENSKRFSAEKGVTTPLEIIQSIQR